MISPFQKPEESQMYNLGQQAREADYKITSCNLSLYNPVRVWWIAGWHDMDIEIKQRVKLEEAA
jgi:hypothetical protein